VMNLDRHEYIIDEVIIGGSLNALLYAWFTGSTLICIDAKEPFFFERFSAETNLDHIGFKNEVSILSSSSREISVGIRKSEVWRKLFFLISMAGQAPIPNSAQALRIEDGVLKVTTSHSRLARFRFNKLKIFDASEIGIRQINSKIRKYKVLDWMWVNTGMIHDLDYIEDCDDFVKEIYFYAYSHRNNRDLKNLIAISYLNGEQLEEYGYSDTYAKFKVEQMMKQNGVKGRRNGYRNGIPYHLNVKVTPQRRELICIDEYDLDLDKNVTYCNLSVEEILKNFDGHPKNKNIKKLLRYWK